MDRANRDWHSSILQFSFLNDFTLPDDTATTGHEVRIPAYSHTREYHHISPVDSNDIGRGLTSGLLRRKDRSHDEEQNRL